MSHDQALDKAFNELRRRVTAHMASSTPEQRKALLHDLTGLLWHACMEDTDATITEEDPSRHQRLTWEEKSEIAREVFRYVRLPLVSGFP